MGRVLVELSVVEQRYQVVLAVVQDGLSVTEIAEKAGVHRQTVHRWLSRYAEEGLAGLSDRSHRPRSCPHQMDPALEGRLVELRQLHPGWGPDRLRYRLAKEGRSPVALRRQAPWWGDRRRARHRPAARGLVGQ